ncbi:MAG: YdcF family protein [Alphaproteobacteria bacterium]|nr:YdcF family protein [Alphaproteobacteria bacterium]
MRSPMFYFVSKIVWFFLTPSNALIVLAIAGLVVMRTRLAPVGWWMTTGAVAALLIAGLSPLAYWIILPLEERFPAFVDDGRTVDGIVVIGGTFDTEPTLLHRQMAMNEAGERIVALGDLARRYPNARIVYSGGGSGFFHEEPEANLLERTIGELGLAPSRVTYERRALNTSQNARYAKDVAEPKPGERWLLVTSAFHMPRAIGAFRAAGFPVEAYPVDFRTAGSASLDKPFAFISQGLRLTDTATKEWIGLLSYYVAGKTSALFPAPEPAAPDATER